VQGASSSHGERSCFRIFFIKLFGLVSPCTLGWLTSSDIAFCLFGCGLLESVLIIAVGQGALIDTLAMTLWSQLILNFTFVDSSLLLMINWAIVVLNDIEYIILNLSRVDKLRLLAPTCDALLIEFR